MCGIAGACGTIDPSIIDAVRRMDTAQLHRGPDSSGFWTSGGGRGGLGAVLAFRRLAIIDLSDDGRQPMVDPETGNVLVFNGEIYNFRSLRNELEGLGAGFRSRSDTEVVLKAYARWGADAIARLRGMFAFGLWDAARGTLLLVRDRLGIKPLYLSSVVRPGGARTLLFASEVRALLASGLVDREADPVALASYVWNGFVVGPRSIVRAVRLLPAATYAIAPQDSAAPSVSRYWALPTPATRSAGSAEALGEELSTSVAMHLVSDVPLGIFLSGGIDSSAIAALAVRSSNARVRTFNVGFEERALDESMHARAVARALGTEHHEVRLSEAAFLREVPSALASLDQPTFDGLNTYFVSRAVREAGLTVALAGTGGDELFGGYSSFRDIPWASSWSRALSALPAEPMRRLATSAARVSAIGWDMPPQTRWGKVGDALAARGDLVDTYQVSYAIFTTDFARRLLTLDLNGAMRAGLPTEIADELRALVVDSPPLSAISLLELRCYLGERLLRDTDATSMASSLEVRVPFVDHEVITAACALNEAERFAPLGRKQLLRDFALGELDPNLFERPKRGFVLPIDSWSRVALREEMTAAFDDPAFSERVALDPGAVRRLWTAFLRGAPGLYWSRVWALYVLGWWCREHGVSVR